jgi:hypothetical protein
MIWLSANSRRDQNEFEFLKFPAVNAQELQSLLVVRPDPSFSLADKVNEIQRLVTSIASVA